MIRIASSSSYFIPELEAGEAPERERILLKICNHMKQVAFSGFISDFTFRFHYRCFLMKSVAANRIFIFAHDISKVPGEFFKISTPNFVF